MTALQLHLKKLVIQKMKDQNQSEIKGMQQNHDNVLKSLDESKAHAQNLQIKHDDT